MPQHQQQNKVNLPFQLLLGCFLFLLFKFYLAVFWVHQRAFVNVVPSSAAMG